MVGQNKGENCTMNRILIIDDDRELCALIKRSVQTENIAADFCNTGKEGLQKLKEQEYQLVILDVMMPGMDGFETLEEIRKEHSLPILMFTSKNDSISKVRGLRAGADDYLTKPFDMDELIARIVSLIRRYTRFNQQAGTMQKLNFDGLQIDLENRSVTTGNGTFELPPKEFDLLLYCVKNQGRILTKQQIYEEVWGEEYFYDDSNIMAIISRLRVKKQIAEMTDVLVDVKNGNGNRRILSATNELTAPLAYEINEIVVAYESRLSAVRQTEETNRQLMTSLSHDVRTPLTTLIGYLDAAHKGIVTGKDRDDYIETARRKAHDLKEYIDVLFDWFKLNSNEFALEIQSIEAAEFTRNILIDWIPIFEDKQVDYDIDIPEQPVRVRLDTDSYMRIINNLIQNVIAHSHADKIKISLSKKENSMELLLADNGVGIEKEDLKHIFERLYKCDKGRSEKGSGLGLSIVHQLVEKMGGSIAVESIPGKGTEFSLRFPLEI